MKKLTMLTCAAFLSLGLPFGIALADVQAIADKCDNCHGKDGNSEDGKVPNIAGMSAIYLTDTLNAYVAGDRKGVKYKPKEGDENDMETVAKKLSEADIEGLATHYAGKQFIPHLQTVDADLAAKGKKIFDKDCEKCHSEFGTVADDDAGILLGQWKPYLKEQFEFFTDGSRTMSKKMAKKFEKLDDEAKAAIIEFLAGGTK